MQLIYGNLFDPQSYYTKNGNFIETKEPVIVITTNGFIKTNNQLVMGRGCAKTATELHSDLSVKLGRLVKLKGNNVHYIGKYEKYSLVSFPVKPARVLCKANKENVVKHMKTRITVGGWVPGWACIADLDLIQQSTYQLKVLADQYKWKYIIIPRPGCGAGELNWNDVYIILDKILDERFYCITFK